MKAYSLPTNLGGEINQLEELINKYKKGAASATELKAHRVPFGVYEQREHDTYMVRIRCAAGAVTPGQFEQIGMIASKYGVSDLHITSRQELQIHYVKLDDIVSVIRELKDIGLATRGGGGNTVRNITVEGDAGIDPQEEFDVSPYPFALTTRLIAESDSWNLPRKYKIAFSGSSEDKGYATIADLGFIAKIKNGVKGFKVYVAGGLGAKSAVGRLLFDFVEEKEVYPIAKALKNVFFKYGNRKNKHAARIRFLWDSLGEEEFKKKFFEEYTKIKQEGFQPLDAAVVENNFSVSGLQEEEFRDADNFSLWKARFVKSQKQDGLYSVLVPIELGFISCQQTSKLAQFLKAFGDDVLRMARGQNILLRNMPMAYLGNVYNFLGGTFKNFNQPVIYGNILSCAGAATCQLGICLSRQAARALIKDLLASGLDLDKIGEVKINISGCPNSCGQHPAADLGFSGKVLRKDGRLYPAYNVFAGAVVHDGRTKLAEQIGEVPARDLPSLVKVILGTYLSNAGKFKSFREYIAKEGKEDLRQICSRYKDIPGFGEDKNYYFDWDADKVFSLADRGAGECSAGFFDLLEMDLNNIKATTDKLSLAGKGGKQKLLSELVFYSSRALLIAKGVDPKNEEEVYEAFIKYFIETGLVAQHFKGIVAAAQRKDYPVLGENESEAYDLAQAIQALYDGMDNSFNFKAPALPSVVRGGLNPSQDNQLEVKPAAVKDFRGVVCPLNFVKTKVELAKLKSGEVLEIWLDDGAPIENVPGSVKAEGHKIIAQKRSADYWSVVIQKK